MFEHDEKKNSGKDVSKMALEKAGGGGTFVLNLYGDWHNDNLLKFASEIGWDIAPIKNWEDLVDFSKKFAKKHYGKGGKL